MLPPLDAADDVTTIYTNSMNACGENDLRTRIKVLEGGGVEVTLPAGCLFDPLLIRPGVEIVIDMQMSASTLDAYVTYALHRVVKRDT